MKTALSLVAVIVVLTIGVIIYSSTTNPQPSDSTLPKALEVQKTEDTEDNRDKTTIKESSRYVEYSKAHLENSKGNRRVLFFYANWCPTCRPADASFSQNQSKIPSDVTLIRVNYNDTQTDQEEKELANKLGVTYQHTFVQIDETGNAVAKWNGGQIDELLQKIK